VSRSIEEWGQEAAEKTVLKIESETLAGSKDNNLVGTPGLASLGKKAANTQFDVF
jgi:hypothetical protein